MEVEGEERESTQTLIITGPNSQLPSSLTCTPRLLASNYYSLSPSSLPPPSLLPPPFLLSPSSLLPSSFSFFLLPLPPPPSLCFTTLNERANPPSGQQDRQCPPSHPPHQVHQYPAGTHVPGKSGKHPPTPEIPPYKQKLLYS